MIRRLRRRFVAVTMVSLLAVLALILGGAALFNYRSLTHQADATLEMLALNEGSFPLPGDLQPAGGHGRDRTSPGWRAEAELPYRSRYFWATADSSGNLQTLNLEKIASVTEEEAAELVRLVLERGKTSGTESEFRYLARRSGSGREYRIYFLDISAETESFYGSLRTGAAVAAAGMLAVGILVMLLSGKAVAPVAESYEKQRRFITNAGHELKTPLAIINADADAAEALSGTENEFLKDIRLQTGKMARLTADLITLSKMEEAGREEKEAVDLSGMADEAADSFRTLAERNGRTLRTDVSEGIIVEGNSAALGRLIGILLDNAVKYSAPGTETVFRLKAQGKNAELSVENSCDPPVTEDECRHFFERFYRGSGGREAGSEGCGIGLSIAAQIVQNHRGKIRALPLSEGRTLVVRCSFPLAEKGMPEKEGTVKNL